MSKEQFIKSGDIFVLTIIFDNFEVGKLVLKAVTFNFNGEFG